MAQFQSALAAVLMEPAALQAFRDDPHAFARSRGLHASHAALLASMDAEGAAYFAARRRIDRFSYLQGDLPRSVAALEATCGTAAYFDANPYARPQPHLEAKQLQAWARAGHHLTSWAADVIQLETEAFLLLHEPHRLPRLTKHPRRAPSVRLVRLNHNPDDLLGRRAAAARAHDGWAALQRTHDDVEVYALEPHAAAILSRAGGRRRAELLISDVERLHPEADVAGSLAELRALGLLCPHG